MTQNYTLNDLIRLVYKEGSKMEQKYLLQELELDWEMKEKYCDLVSAAKQLPKVTFAPSSASVTNILRYSQETALPVDM